MSIAALAGITHHFDKDNLFNHVSLTIERNSRFGLIGRNGTGKTTLFEMLAGNLKPVSGSVHVARGRKIAYLTQEPCLPEDKTLYEVVLSSRQDILQLTEDLRNARELVSHNPSPANLLKLGEAEHEFEFAGGYQAEQTLKYILLNLGLLETFWHRPVKSFSGGEKTRIQLAAILATDFDLLLLDEPTNHLDISMIIWLENFLLNSNRPYIIISHDRHFLDKTVTSILELRHGKLHSWGGNYSQYLAEYERRNELQEKEYKAQQKFINRTEDFIRRNMAGQKVAMAKSRLKMLNRMEKIDRVSREKDVKIRFSPASRSGNDVFRLEEVGFGFGDETLARKINLNVFLGDKIAIIGKNGCGKTTLLRILN
ncbi:MAG: ATP-binding cassette domain-containing protein, partial [Candidatus Cloacimonetes bacterium]|nr:ATP-binding cassette domain-containing protein [Candidatus Cloacimonadota bacterium]